MSLRRFPFLSMNVRRAGVGLAVATVLAVASFATAAAPVPPPFPSTRAKDWIGTPATWESLRGRVVLLDVWTFACSNCRATMPWLKDVRQRYEARGLSLVGVHTPEMTIEHDRKMVASEVKRQGLDYPHYIDDNAAYWRALGNQYWPTVYLVDRCGRLRGSRIGEIHSGEESGKSVEAGIEALLAEPADNCAETPPAAAAQ
ncbi:MAG TPA: redoxin family protein [Vicinamibacteria bacterium]|nr:redoxin family protein [Vicinamibacteria bacterium]